MRAADLLTILTKSPKNRVSRSFWLKNKTGACDNGPDK